MFSSSSPTIISDIFSEQLFRENICAKFPLLGSFVAINLKKPDLSKLTKPYFHIDIPNSFQFCFQGIFKGYLFPFFFKFMKLNLLHATCILQYFCIKTTKNSAYTLVLYLNNLNAMSNNIILNCAKPAPRLHKMYLFTQIE